MPAFFRSLFDTNFMPHLYCLRGAPDVLWLHVIADLLVAVSYYAIPLVLLQVVLKRTEVLFRRLAVLFVLFIAACGTTHLLAVWTIWHPIYRFEGMVKALTALLSVVTAIVLVLLEGRIRALPSLEELEREIELRSKAEEASRDKEERFRNFVESTQDYAMYMIDLEGRVLSWNAGAERMKGYRAEEIIGQPFHCFYTAEDRYAEIPEEALAAAAQGGYESEGWRVRKDGSRFRAHVSMRPLYGTDGKIRSYAKITRDLTKTREAEHRFEMVFEYAPDAMLICDRGGRIRMANLRMEKLYQHSRKELMQASVEDLVPERLREGSRKRRAEYLERMGQRIEGNTSDLEVGMDRRGLRKDGREFLLEVRASSIELGGEPAVLMLHRDITDRYKAEQRFRSLLESAPDAMLIVNDRGQIELANLQAERLFGYTRAELIGQPVEMLIPEPQREGHQASRRSYAAMPRSRAMGAGMELSALRKDRSLFPVEISLSPLEGPEGISVTAAIRDTTERRRAEARFRSLLESAPDAMVISDSAGLIQLVNLETERLFGYTRAELVGKPVDVLIPPDLRGSYEQDMQSFFTCEGAHPMGAGKELRAMRKDGTEFPVEINFSPLEGPDGLSVTAAIRDMTERRKAAQLLDEKVKELRSSNQDLEQFAYIASHDLQEPLRMVASYTQLLSRRYKGKLDEDADTFIGYAVDGTQRMKRLIEGLLVYSRVGKGAFVAEVVSAGRALEQALQNLQTSIVESGARVTHEGLSKVLASEVQLTQVFQNLVGNAIKYRKEKMPEIHIAARDGGTEWIFSVADNGIGIDAEYYERIFLIFQRLHGREEYEGTGIGLAICKRMLQSMGGSIWVESVPGHGSTFFFSLPKG